MTVKVFTRDDDLERWSGTCAHGCAVRLPRGVSWDMGERFEQMQKQAESFLFAILPACTFVFLLMGVLFESFVLPFSVIVSIPFAFFGVYWTLWATDTPQDVMASIGVVILTGIVVNNAIVLVDQVNRLRAEGLTARRLCGRPDGRGSARSMTALTTIVGLLPMAAGTSNIVGVPYYPWGARSRRSAGQHPVEPAGGAALLAVHTCAMGARTCGEDRPGRDREPRSSCHLLRRGGRFPALALELARVLLGTDPAERPVSSGFRKHGRNLVVGTSPSAEPRTAALHALSAGRSSRPRCGTACRTAGRR